MSLKDAIASTGREFRAKLTFENNLIYEDENIINITLSRGVSSKEDFEIGTAFMQMCEIELMGIEGQTNFENQYVLVEIEINNEGNWEPLNCGTYFVDKVTKSLKMNYKLECVDRMYMFEKIYECDLEFPKTILEIAQDICLKAGVPLGTNNFINADKVVEIKPQFYDMTLRECIADIAELAAGYAFIDPITQALAIKNIEVDSGVILSEDTTIDFKRKESSALIETIIIRQKGVLDESRGSGDHPYYIVDNVFIQGDADKFIDNIYNELNGFEYTPCDIKWIGNPIELINGMATLEFDGITYNIFPTTRILKYSGGIREDWKCTKLSNTAPPEESNYVRTIQKNEAKILVLDNEIQSRVTKTELEEAIDNIDIDVEIGGIRNLFILDKLKNLENINIIDRGFRIESDYVVVDDYILENILPDEEYTIQAAVSIVDGDANLNFGKISLYNPTTSTELLLLPGGIEGQNSNTFISPIDIEEYTELRIYGIDEGIVEFLEIKIGKGSTTSEYTISPEDIQARLNEKVGQEDLANTVLEYQSAIEQKADEITQSIDEKIIDFENDLTEQYRSELTQTTDAFNIKFEELHGRISDSDEKITGVQTYFNFGSDALEIGKSDSIFDIKISNSSMVFNRSKEPVAWINAEEEKLFIKNAQMTESTIVGVHIIEKYNSDITFIRHIGGEAVKIPPNGLSINYYEDASNEEDPWRQKATWNLSYRGEPEGLVYFDYLLEGILMEDDDWDTWVERQSGTTTSAIDGEGMSIYFQLPELVSMQYVALRLTVTATFEKFPNILLQETRVYFDYRPKG